MQFLNITLLGLITLSPIKPTTRNNRDIAPSNIIEDYTWSTKSQVVEGNYTNGFSSVQTYNNEIISINQRSFNHIYSAYAQGNLYNYTITEIHFKTEITQLTLTNYKKIQNQTVDYSQWTNSVYARYRLDSRDYNATNQNEINSLFSLTATNNTTWYGTIQPTISHIISDSQVINTTAVNSEIANTLNNVNNLEFNNMTESTFYFLERTEINSTNPQYNYANQFYFYTANNPYRSIYNIWYQLTPTPEGDITINYEVIDLGSLLFDILAMPFAFISQAFNLTLFVGTPYAINISSIFLALAYGAILIIILKIILGRLS